MSGRIYQYIYILSRANDEAANVSNDLIMLSNTRKPQKLLVVAQAFRVKEAVTLFCASYELLLF